MILMINGKQKILLLCRGYSMHLDIFFLISNVNIIYKVQRGATLIQRIYKRNPYGIYKEHIFKNSSIVETSLR
jgi:hypothetical protein